MPEYPSCINHSNKNYHAPTRKLWIEKFGPIPDGLLVLHKCGNKRCRNFHHLYLGTYSDNEKDKRKPYRWFKLT